MQQVEIYVVERDGYWLEYLGQGEFRRTPVSEGAEGPIFLSLPEYLWEALVGVLPDPEESFTRSLLEREQYRVDMLIDHILKD